DLLNHFPFRYIDRTKFYKIKEIPNVVRESNDVSPYIQVRGTLKSLVTKGEKWKKILIGKLQDETGVIELVWFQGLRWLIPSLKLNSEYIIFGKLTEYN